MREAEVFFDTNILVYAHDISAGEKHAIAREKVEEIWETGSGLLSTQVLQEFFVVVTGKIPNPISAEEAEEIISALLKWEVIINDGDSILRAIDLHKRVGYSFWDCLIIDAAIEGQAETLLSEDLAQGQTIKGVKIINPFE